MYFKNAKRKTAYLNIGQAYQPALTCLTDCRKQRELINFYIIEIAQATPFHHNSFQTGTLTKIQDTEYKH